MTYFARWADASRHEPTAVPATPIVTKSNANGGALGLLLPEPPPAATAVGPVPAAITLTGEGRTKALGDPLPPAITLTGDGDTDSVGVTVVVTVGPGMPTGAPGTVTVLPAAVTVTVGDAVTV